MDKLSKKMTSAGLGSFGIFAVPGVDPMTQVKWIGLVMVTYIAGQAIVDFAKAWRAQRP